MRIQHSEEMHSPSAVWCNQIYGSQLLGDIEHCRSCGEMHVYKCYDVDLTCLASRGLSTIREDRVRWQEFVYHSAHFGERCNGKMTLLKEHNGRATFQVGQ